MRYFKVPSVNVADKVSSLFYKLMTPEGSNTSTTHIFGWLILNNGEVVIAIDELMTCPVYPRTVLDTTDSILNQIVTYLNNVLTTAQKTALKNYVKNAITNGTKVDLIKLIPAALTEVDLAYVQSHTTKP